jgi:hypothetical protein
MLPVRYEVSSYICCEKMLPVNVCEVTNCLQSEIQGQLSMCLSWESLCENLTSIVGYLSRLIPK